MKFPYVEYVCQVPGIADFRFVYRPIISLRVTSPTGATNCDALVDTGADETLLPLSIAEVLEVELHDASSQATGVSGEQLTIRYGDVDLQIRCGEEAVSWRTTVGFFDFPSTDDEVAILGHLGCLDYFTVIFDGELTQLELLPNSYLPAL